MELNDGSKKTKLSDNTHDRTKLTKITAANQSFLFTNHPLNRNEN